MRFTKMHGTGNDYVYVNGFEEAVADPAALAVKVADRHFGVGGDGLILILPSKVADVRMRMFNADGSEAEMCGNGIRCVAKFSYDHGLSSANPLRVETGNGILPVALEVAGGTVSAVTVDMGEPVLALEKIPVVNGAAGRNAALKRVNDHEFALQINAPGGPPNAVFVSMGNPHAVIFCEDVDAVDLNDLGPKVEHYPAFPNRINAHWVQVISPAEVKIRTWERGSGVTLACGTGACAVAVAGALTGRTGREILAHLPGGDLRLEWRASDGHVYMTGPAEEVFTGEIDV